MLVADGSHVAGSDPMDGELNRDGVSFASVADPNRARIARQLIGPGALSRVQTKLTVGPLDVLPAFLMFAHRPRADQIDGPGFSPLVAQS